MYFRMKSILKNNHNHTPKHHVRCKILPYSNPIHAITNKIKL
jgi:hypothetical protein